MGRLGRKIARNQAKAAEAEPQKAVTFIAVVRKARSGGHHCTIEVPESPEILATCNGTTLDDAVKKAVDIMRGEMDSVTIVKVLVEGKR